MTVEDTIENIIRPRLHDLAGAAQRIEGKIGLIEQHLRVLNGKVEDHEGRVRQVEQAMLAHTVADGHAGMVHDLNGLGQKVSDIAKQLDKVSSGFSGWKAVLAAAGVVIALTSPWIMYMLRG